MTRFGAWLKSAPPGDQFVYYTGAAIALANSQVLAMSDEARLAYDRGEIELTQKRLFHGQGPHGVGQFDYIATRRRHTKVPPVLFSSMPREPMRSAA